MEDICNACGQCCKKHWLLRLTNEHEKSLFEGDVVFGSFIWTDKCKYHINNLCSIHEGRPQKCKEYFCEGNLK